MPLVFIFIGEYSPSELPGDYLQTEPCPSDKRNNKFFLNAIWMIIKNQDGFYPRNALEKIHTDIEKFAEQNIYSTCKFNQSKI